MEPPDRGCRPQDPRPKGSALGNPARGSAPGLRGGWGLGGWAFYLDLGGCLIGAFHIAF